MPTLIIVSAKKIVAGILADVFKGNRKYSKNIAETPVITCDEIICYGWPMPYNKR